MKFLVPNTFKVIQDYHIKYGPMCTKKSIKALEEHIYMRGLYRKVRNVVKTWRICKLVKYNNKRKEVIMIPIRSNKKLEKVFVDICDNSLEVKNAMHTNNYSY